MITRRKPRKRKRSRDCATGLRRYRDQAEAIGAIHVLQVVSTREVIPVRSFPCRECQGWHTSSREMAP